MTTPHPQAELLLAIADGKQMQLKGIDEWIDCCSEAALVRISMGMPTRIKPEPKPDVVKYANIYTIGVGPFYDTLPPATSGAVLHPIAVLEITINGETGKASAELV